MQEILPRYYSCVHRDRHSKKLKDGEAYVQLSLKLLPFLSCSSALTIASKSMSVDRLKSTVWSKPTLFKKSRWKNS